VFRVERTPCSLPDDIAKASSEDIAKALEKDGRVAISGGILFETDSARLAPSAVGLVGKVSDVMKKHPDLKIAVVGHTDSTGDYKYNLQLSERRANAMVDAIAKNGVAATRLAAVGIGPLSPIASNDTAEGRAQNRRVELVLIQ
jgi:OOP family OmpA-OmpF porin